MKKSDLESFPTGPRLDLRTCAGMCRERWCLLPGESIAAEALESTLAWQTQVYSRLLGEPRVEVWWEPDFSHPSRVAKVLASIAAQSVTQFRLLVTVDPQEAARARTEFGQWVGPAGALSFLEVAAKLELGERIALTTRDAPSAGSSSAEWVLHLRSDDCLHPMALFALLKEVQRRPADVVGFFETLTDDSTGGPHAVHMPGGISLYSVFGDAGISRSLWIAGDVWRRHAGLVNGKGSWRWAVAAVEENLVVCRLSMALTALESPRKSPVRVSPGDVAIRSGLERMAAERGIALADWRFDEVRGSGCPVPVPSRASIAVIVPFRNQEELTAATFRSLVRQSVAERVRLVAIDNGSSPAVSDRLRSLAVELFGEARVTWLTFDEPFNFAALNNRGVASCDEPHLLFLNNDVEFLRENDLEHLQGFLEWPEVGMAGGALHYPDGELQAAGIRFGSAGPAVIRKPDEGALVFGEVDALTFACAFARRTAFEAAGGLDELVCPNGFGDALLGHRMGKAGWRILCDPSVAVRHHESKSRGSRPEELERSELAAEGIPLYLYGTEFLRTGQPMIQRFGRSRPTLGKRIYRAVKAFTKELRK